MGVFTDHPHTAITTTINGIIESDLEPEVELPELLDVINLQYSGAIEAARAIRKKLKYGQLREQLKSLELLNALVSNGGRDLTELYNDRKLLDRLRESATDPAIDVKVRKTIIIMAIFWNENFSDSKYHLGVAKLKNQLPKVTRAKKKKPSRRDFMNDEAYHSDNEDDGDEEPERPRRTGTGSSRGSNTGAGSRSSQARSDAEANRKYNIPTINIKKEAPKIKILIAEASTASINLTNALKSLHRDQGELATDSKRATVLFDKTRIIRKKILRYLQLTDSEEFLGSLIHANEELVAALQLYTEYSSQHDSDDYSSLSEDSGNEEDSDVESVTDSLASSMIEEYSRRGFPQTTRAPPTVPVSTRASSGVVRPRDDDPFGDSNQVDESADWK
jgi:hypothetical protein